MRITLLGFTHRNGTSRATGRPYDFFEISCLLANPDKSYVGEQAKVFPSQADLSSGWQAGKDYDIYFNEFGRLADVREV